MAPVDSFLGLVLSIPSSQYHKESVPGPIGLLVFWDVACFMATARLYDQQNLFSAVAR